MFRLQHLIWNCAILSTISGCAISQADKDSIKQGVAAFFSLDGLNKTASPKNTNNTSVGNTRNSNNSCENPYYNVEIDPTVKISYKLVPPQKKRTPDMEFEGRAEYSSSVIGVINYNQRCPMMDITFEIQEKPGAKWTDGVRLNYKHKNQDMPFNILIHEYRNIDTAKVKLIKATCGLCVY